MLAVKMSEGGRVVIPAELREQLQFKQGDQLLMEVKNGALVVTSKAQRIAQMRDEILAAAGLDVQRAVAGPSLGGGFELGKRFESGQWCSVGAHRVG